jgi:hypothetical protein
MSRHPNSKLLIGPLSPRTPSGKHYVPAPFNFAPPINKVCNASMPPNSLDASKLVRPPARPGADQHAQYKSRGTGC